MCGIFGFITRQGEGPEIARLRRLAWITQARGEHAFGLAWLNESGTIQTFKRPGPAQNYLGELERCRYAIIVVGLAATRPTARHPTTATTIRTRPALGSSFTTASSITTKT